MTVDGYLLESDRTYFECGARLTPLPGAVLAHLAGFEDLAAGAVVHRIDPGGLAPDPLTWLVALEKRLAALGVQRAQLYLDVPAPELEWALTHIGYRCREEVGLLHPAAPLQSDVTLTPIRDEEDWHLKQALHPDNEPGPDGHTNNPVRWVAFERFKQAAGYFTLYLARHHGEVCGAMGMAEVGPMMRLKNFVVAPAHRRRGVGAAMLRAGVRLAQDRNKAVIGGFAMAGDAGEALYLGSGFTPVTRQWGWDRLLTVAAPVRRFQRTARAHR
jgi:GNAT superfamily N-acetyltransferase